MAHAHRGEGVPALTDLPWIVSNREQNRDALRHATVWPTCTAVGFGAHELAPFIPTLVVRPCRADELRKRLRAP